MNEAILSRNHVKVKGSGKASIMFAPGFGCDQSVWNAVIIAPATVGKYMHQHLPYSSLKQMEARGHCPHMSHPDETIQLIGDYLKAHV